MFYEYRQNNSGGRFLAPAVRVFVEADTPDEADTIAEWNGLYFDGVDGGRDCPCCGDRWCRAYDWGTHEEIPKPNMFETTFAGDGIPARHIIMKENH